MKHVVKILLAFLGILFAVFLVCASYSCDTEEHGVVVAPSNPWPSADKLLARTEAANASAPLRKKSPSSSSSSAWFPTTPAGSAMAWGAVALTIIGGFITRSRGKLDYSAIPLALGLGILVFVVLKPTGFEFHLIPTSPWFWAALIFWGIAKIIPTRFDEYAIFAGVGLLFLLSLALRGIDPGSSYRFLSPAWWLLLLIWEVVIAEKVILGNEELRQRPFLRNLLLAGGWYILGAISSFG